MLDTVLLVMGGFSWRGWIGLLAAHSLEEQNIRKIETNCEYFQTAEIRQTPWTGTSL